MLFIGSSLGACTTLRRSLLNSTIALFDNNNYATKRKTYEETTWPTNKHSPAMKLITYEGKSLQVFLFEIIKFKTPINSQQQISN